MTLAQHNAVGCTRRIAGNVLGDLQTGRSGRHNRKTTNQCLICTKVCKTHVTCTSCACTCLYTGADIEQPSELVQFSSILIFRCRKSPFSSGKPFLLVDCYQPRYTTNVVTSDHFHHTSQGQFSNYCFIPVDVCSCPVLGTKHL